MTLLDEPKAQPSVDDAELLFHEAKLRRRRRWLVSGTVAAILAVVLGITLGLTVGRGRGAAGRSASPGAASGVASGVGHATASLTFRPVLCAAPPLTLVPGQAVSTGPLPSCSPTKQWSATNLQVTPDSNNVDGYTTVNPSGFQPDPKFATYPSTTKASQHDGTTVLLPATPAFDDDRYVLGPAAVTSAQIKSAHAIKFNGQWAVDLVLTDQGALRFDTLAQQQFHAVIGVVFKGKVISAPITQPTQSHFSTFNGHVQITGAFGEARAKAIASSL